MPKHYCQHDFNNEHADGRAADVQSYVHNIEVVNRG